MATANSLLVCTHCLTDLAEVDPNKPCPQCGSVDHVKTKEVREYKQLLVDKGLTPLEPITTQMREKRIEIDRSKSSYDEKIKTADAVTAEAVRYLVTAPMSVKNDAMADVLQMATHGLLSQGEDAKNFISMGIKLGNICRNLNEYMELRYGRKNG